MTSQTTTGQGVTSTPCPESGEDRTPFELFIAGVRGWEAGLRRQIEDGKPKLE